MIKSIITLSIFLTMVGFCQAQEKKIATDTLAVAGVCGMCESRIENAASIAGVKKAEWDKQKQELIVIYSTKKTSLDEISKAIQDAGHDTGKGPATAGTYEQIDKCCRYREMEVH